MEVSETSNDNDVDQSTVNNNDNDNEDSNDEDGDSENLKMVQDVKEDVDVKIEPKETILDEDGSTVEETYEITTTRRKTTTTTYKIQEVMNQRNVYFNFCKMLWSKPKRFCNYF
ncbi:hypothetical protein KQX54_014268 [Cotesia glomerata]|uniref:Uncharacterized protein n=1 Tax=Cotesia glomerata TaxID=32391 RepID=A0AAV7IQ30_COTGL|nr:hypothetical protein KQX54_014268 [Cotesia glomerata]